MGERSSDAVPRIGTGKERDGRVGFFRRLAATACWQSIDRVGNDPWHYVPVPAHKPGALRNGAPFREWVLPAAMEKVRKRLRSADDGDRQMVTILGCVPADGLAAVEAACQEAPQSRRMLGFDDPQHPGTEP